MPLKQITPGRALSHIRDSMQEGDLPPRPITQSTYRAIVLATALLVLVVIIFLPLLRTGFTTKDDTELALVADNPSQWVPAALNIAKSQGRFSASFMVLGYFVPRYLAGPVWFHFLSVGSILLNLAFFFVLARRILGSRTAALLPIFFALTFLQNNWCHNLLTSYPILPHFGLTCLFIAILAFIRWQESQRLRYAVAAGAFYFVSLSFESFIPHILFFLASSIYQSFRGANASVKGKLRRSLKSFSPIALSLILYLACYAGFRAAYPTTYDGNRLNVGSLSRTWTVIWQYASSTVPGYFYFRDAGTIEPTLDGFSPHAAGVGELLGNCRAEWLAKALVAAVLCALVLLAKRRVFTSRSFIVALVAGLGWIIFPVSLLGLTAKYQAWVVEHGSLAYSPSYFSYFGTVFVLGCIVLYLNQLLSSSRYGSLFYLIGVAAAVAVGSLSTDYYNYYVALDQQLSHLKWRTINRFVETPEFGSLPRDSVIYAPSLWRFRGIVANDGDYWGQYLSQRSGRPIWVARNVSQFNALTVGTARPSYFLAFRQEPKDPDQFVVFSTLEQGVSSSGAVYGRRFDLFTYSKNRVFTLVGEASPGEEPLQVASNGRPVQHIDGRIFIDQVDQRGTQSDFPKTTVTSTAPLDITHLIVSYFAIEPFADRIELVYGRGFHGMEGDPTTGSVWNWSLAQSEISLLNLLDHPVEKNIEFSLAVFSPRNIAIQIDQFRRTVSFVSGASERVELTHIILKPGDNKLYLSSDEPAQPPGNGDIRPMAFGVYNLSITETPK